MNSDAARFAGLVHDIRYGVRLLRRQPRFAFLATLTMALGIGATTTLFSITYGMLVKPLPWPAGDRIVVLKETRGGNPPRFGAYYSEGLRPSDSPTRALARRFDGSHPGAWLASLRSLAALIRAPSPLGTPLHAPSLAAATARIRARSPTRHTSRGGIARPH